MKKIIRCTNNRNHWYSDHTDNCPWCELTQKTGFDPFPDNDQLSEKTLKINGNVQLSEYKENEVFQIFNGLFMHFHQKPIFLISIFLSICILIIFGIILLYPVHHIDQSENVLYPKNSQESEKPIQVRSQENFFQERQKNSIDENNQTNILPFLSKTQPTIKNSVNPLNSIPKKPSTSISTTKEVSIQPIESSQIKVKNYSTNVIKDEFIWTIQNAPKYLLIKCSPQMVTDTVCPREARCLKKTSIAKNAWFEINVLDGISRTQIAREGFGKEFGYGAEISDPSGKNIFYEKLISIYQNGNIIINCKGANVKTTVELLNEKKRV